ncbi:MAG: TrkH family potassium uptake protein, partial [Firmicutes bacterium]|nr:TrkH family potassium uptake protein [Bacillota bacterium]
MNKKMIARIVGIILIAEAAFMILPIITAAIYEEWVPFKAFITSAVLLGLIGLPMMRIPAERKNIFTREGLAAVALCWVAISLGGALPFMLSGE